MKKASYEDAKRATLGKVMDVNGVELLPMKREVGGEYRLQKINGKVASLREEVAFCFAAALKGFATQQDHLPELWCEALLVPKGAKLKFKAKIDASMLKEAAAARAMVCTLVRGAAADTADVVQKVVLSKTAALLLMDSDFGVELSVLNKITSDGTGARTHEDILGCLPMQRSVISAEASAQLLRNLAAGDLFKLSSRAGQQKLRATQQLVDSIAEGRKPDVSMAKECGFIGQVISTFQWFVTARVENKDVYGTDALLEILAVTTKKHQAKQATLQDVAPLQVFRWLLPPEKAEAADLLAKEISKTAATMIDRMKGASSSSKGASKKPGTQKASADTALQAALDMFA